MKKWFLIIIVLMLAAAPVSAQRANVKSTEVVLVDGQDYYLHKVVKGETLYSLSKLYDVSQERIEFDNPQLRDGLKSDQVIRILCVNIPEPKMSARKKARLFAQHTVSQGETTYSIARRYSLSINVLVQDNPGLDPTRLSIGQKLNIRKSEIGETSPDELLSEIDSYAATLNKVSEGYLYHVVEIGETLYSLSRAYGVSQDIIAEHNDVSGGLRAGAMLKIPAEKRVGPDDEVLPPSGTTTEVAPQYEYKGVLNMAMLLPLSGPSVSTANRTNFVEFYQGALLAMEDFKNEGYTINANLFDTQRSVEKTSHIVASHPFAATDLVIGPVYEENLQPVIEFARERGVPVVSPLAQVGGPYGELLYQMSPPVESKYDKLKPVFEGNKNVVFITSGNTDTEFEREMTALLGGEIPYQRVVYRKGTPAEYIDSLLMNPHQENVFVVLAAEEYGVEMVLAAISSVQNNRLARSRATSPIRVVGNSRWLRYRDLDRSLLFKLNVSFVANYHADRSSAVVSEFDSRYMAAFNELPSLYSYRGYDAVKLFAGAMMTTSTDLPFTDRVNSVGIPLQAPYYFERNASGNSANGQWALINYKSNYTIIVE